jgi:peptidoglycan/xylan/chitin deacetylase (PgdA/CDA1 family)
MSGYSDQWVTLTSEALRTRRDEVRRRKRRRRRWLTALAVCLLAAVAAVGVLVLGRSGASAARAAHHARHLRHGRHHVRPPLTPAQLAAIEAAHENAAIDRLLTRQPFIRSGGPERRMIALTFDDGPGPYTPHLVDVLNRLHVPATFFEVGFMFRWYQRGAASALHDGDVIGDHTESHPRMALLPAAAQRGQILDQTQWTSKLGAPFPRLWRPPYGSFNAATLALLKHFHMLMVLWTVDTQDYLRPGVKAIVRRALAGARPGAIILLHDAGGNRSQTIAALPLIVRALRKRGYQLVTVPRLILEDPPLAPQPLPAHVSGD